MIDLDEQERQALARFIQLLEQEQFGVQATVDEQHIARGLDKHIVVPVAVPAAQPDLHMAMLMARKAEQLYKQTGCRFLLAQKPMRDPKGGVYIWADGVWHRLP